jgi:hypothetical protein
VSLSKEGELYRAVVRQLTAHVGGKPSATQALLIGRLAWLQVHLAHLDQRAMSGTALSDHVAREYLAWTNTMTRGLARLGLDAPPTPRETVLQRLQREAATHPSQPTSPAAQGPVTPPRMLPRMHQSEALAHSETLK